MATVTDHDVQDYLDQGFLAIPGLVTADELDVLRADIVSTIT